MSRPITFITPQTALTSSLANSGIPLITYGTSGPETRNNYPFIRTSSVHSAAFLKAALEAVQTKYALLATEPWPLSVEAENLQAFTEPLESDNAIFVYSNYNQINSVTKIKSEVNLIAYQMGAVRDEFAFGPLLAVDVRKVLRAISDFGILNEQKFSGLYALRLCSAMAASPFHINQPLYSVEVGTSREEYEKQFAYVDPKNSAVQREMEETFTEYSRKEGFYLSPRSQKVTFTDQSFPVEATVVIPVRNRENTVRDAVESALSQKVSAPFNVIVVDNHSTDKTSEILRSLSGQHSNLVHLVPEERDLLIGGCWNKAIQSDSCGRFAVQLDSDDLYVNEHTLQRIIDVFYAEAVGAVVGSYKLVDFQLNDIPPGLIDHREWSTENGHNNALRINGLGAPRAFYTPIVRDILFENVSYGEDYAMMLAVCRNYPIGRIYDPLYLCRRWTGNSDADLPQEKVNKNNSYKDLIRTREIKARLEMNGSSRASRYVNV